MKRSKAASVKRAADFIEKAQTLVASIVYANPEPMSRAELIGVHNTLLHLSESANALASMKPERKRRAPNPKEASK